MNDSNEKAPESQEGNAKEPMVNEEVDDEKGDPNIVENDDVKIDLFPNMKVPPPFPQSLKKMKDNSKFKIFHA